jgi:chromosome partitioning protein
MRCIAVINQKGGCGKTTVATNLSACLAVKGYRTLLVDMDPQSHCAVGLAVPENQIEKNIYDLLITAYDENRTELKHIVWQISKNFDLAPSNIELAALEPQLAGQDHREDRLLDVLAADGVDYDFAIIDCPPSVGLLTFNALRAANEVIIPVETGYFALHGLTKQIETLNVLKQQCQQKITTRVLASMYDVRTKLAREVLNELKKHHHAMMFNTIINFNTKLKEASSFGQPITEYDPSSKGMHDFIKLAEEIAEAVTVQPHKEQLTSLEAELRAISKTANELLAESRETLGEHHAAYQQEATEQTIEARIDRFYGIKQDQGKITFAALYPKAQQVQIAGDFNNWQPEQSPLLKSDDGRWEIELPLSQGTYNYRYVVDGRWQQDPYNKHVSVNPYGDFNSHLEVK